MTKKYLFLLILLIASVGVFSGCVKRQVNKSQEAQKQATTTEEKNIATTTSEILPKEEIKYLENGEIDTDDWKTYRNDYYKLEMKYPPFLNAGDNKEKSFGFNSKVDSNYYYYFGKINYFDEMGLEELENRIDYCIKYYNDQPDFKEIKIKNGYIYYYIQKTKGGYTPSATILGKNNSLWGSARIEDKNPTLKSYNPKYIDIFKTSLETIKFDD